MQTTMGLLWGLAVLAAPAYGDGRGGDERGAAAVAGLDHVPVAVGDLEAAAARYRALGFTIKPGRPHDDGIRNQHVKFADGTELELITAPAARDALTAEYRRHLARGDGPAFLGLYAPDLDGAAARLDAAGVAHERDGDLIGFGPGDELHYLFLGGRSRSPTDRPEHFVHANGAEALIGVWLASERPAVERRRLALLGAVVRDERVRVPAPMTRPVARFAGGEVVLLPAARQVVPGRRIVGVTVRVRSLDQARRALAAGGWPVGLRAAGRSLFLPPGLTHGLWLELREPRR